MLTILWQEDEVARYDRTWHITGEQANTHIWPIPRPAGETPTDSIDLSQMNGRELLPGETKTALDPKIGRFHPELYENFGDRCEAFKHNSVAATLWNYTRYHQTGRQAPKETKDALRELEVSLGDKYETYSYLFPRSEHSDDAGAAAAATEEAPIGACDNENTARPSLESAKSDGEPGCQDEPGGATTAAKEGGAPEGIADDGGSGKTVETDKEAQRAAHDAAENTTVDVSGGPNDADGNEGEDNAGQSAQDDDSNKEGTGEQTGSASNADSCEVIEE